MNHISAGVLLTVCDSDTTVMCADGFGVDWPLVLGSLSAVLLFLCSVVIVAVVVQRKGTLKTNL